MFYFYRCAMGQCYENEQLGMVDEAIKCYRKAAENGDREGESITIDSSSIYCSVSYAGCI